MFLSFVLSAKITRNEWNRIRIWSLHCSCSPAEHIIYSASPSFFLCARRRLKSAEHADLNQNPAWSEMQFQVGVSKSAADKGLQLSPDSSGPQLLRTWAASENDKCSPTSPYLTRCDSLSLHLLYTPVHTALLLDFNLFYFAVSVGYCVQHLLQRGIHSYLRTRTVPVGAHTLSHTLTLTLWISGLFTDGHTEQTDE